MPAKITYHYVYILVSVGDPSRHYTGCTTDLQERLTRHNQGRNPHTAKYAPWQIQTAIRFSDPDKAGAYERYLKSGFVRANFYHTGTCFTEEAAPVDANVQHRTVNVEHRSREVCPPSHTHLSN